MAGEHDQFPSCDVCGRTILKGEQIHEYLTQQRQRIGVCVLCRSRAETSGWIPVSMAHTIADEQPRRSPGQALRQRLSRAASRARSSARSRGGSAPRGRGAKSGSEPDLEEAWAESAAPAPAPVEAQARSTPPDTGGAASSASAPDGAAEVPPPAALEPQEEPNPARKAEQPRARRQQRQRPAKPSAKPAAEAKSTRKGRAKRGPEALMRQAVDRFNASEERRKVAGLIRSLGGPQAGVRPDQRRQLAVVTVAWELSWYQWEVRAEGDEAESVREVAKGAELSELAEESRSWNAAADEDGTLRLRSAAEPEERETAKET